MKSIFKSQKIKGAFERLLDSVQTHESVIVHSMSSNESEEKCYYRLLQNPRLEVSEVLCYLHADCTRQVESGSHYLVFSDTSQYNVERNRQNIKDTVGLGVIGDDKSLGFFLHASLAVDASTGRCIGYSDVQVWSRSADKEKKVARGYKKLPIESKESYRWLTCAAQSRERLLAAGKVTVVQDREGDISESFARRGDYDLLIRSRDDRKLVEGKLHAYLASQTICGSFELQLKGDIRTNRKARKAQIEVRFAQVHLHPAGALPHQAPIYVVEAREINAPEGQEPILWRLLTTHLVTNFEEACQIIEWYALRWNIEQIFRLTKQKGFNVEDSDMERGSSLIILTLLALLSASKILLLHLASKQEAPVPIKDTFTQQELQCMKAVCLKYEGNTPKQKNNYPPDSLQWAYWVLARVGGWKPKEKQAGVITLLRGWKRFQQIFEGWEIAQKFVS
jgi:hypothetical protein